MPERFGAQIDISLRKSAGELQLIAKAAENVSKDVVGLALSRVVISESVITIICSMELSGPYRESKKAKTGKP